MKSENGEVLKTYKNGIKLPESLTNPFNKLVREREVLQFLLKYPNAEFSKKQYKKLSGVATKSRNPEKRKWECFKAHKNLRQASEAIRIEYRNIFKKYGEWPLQEVELVLRANQQKITFFRRNKLHYDATLNLKGLFKQPAKPDPTKISLRDYQNIARKYLKQLCGNSRKYALENIESLPLDEKLTERKVTTILGNKANHLHSVSTQLATMMNVCNDTRRKVEFVKKLLQTEGENGVDFREVLPVYLSFYSVPTHFRNYLAKAWKVDPNWVRNTLVGWRRKVDPLLPKKVRIEPLTAFMGDLARYCEGFCREERELKIIGLLQQKHVLHLLPTKIPLSSLLPPKYGQYLDGLREKIVFSQEILDKIEEFKSRIGLDFFSHLTLELSGTIRTSIAELEENTPRYKRTITFLNKLDFLNSHISNFKEILQNYLPGNRYTASASKIIVNTLNKEGKNRNRIKRLFTALRGVIAPAFVHLYPGVTAQFGEYFTPDNCVTRPFTANRKHKKYLPLELKSPKYVILRKKHPTDKNSINNQETTELFKENKPLWLGFNIYTPNQFLADGKITGRHKGTLWFRLFPTKKIRDCIKKGAVIKSIRLNVPRGATNKIIADIILGADSRAPFIHSARFLKQWEGLFRNVAIPASLYLGQDLNRLGKYMIALGNDRSEVDISELLVEFERGYRKLELFRKKIIPALQKNLTRKRDGKKGRRATELTNLHNKRGKLMQEYNRRVLMVYLYAIWKSKARHVSWDGLEGLTTRGKKGDFAVAIQYLPNHLAQFELFREWLDDLKLLELIPQATQIHLVSPFTSEVCPLCYSSSGKLNKNRDKTTDYHAFKCKTCGYTGNRHSTAAMVEAISIKKAIEGIP